MPEENVEEVAIELPAMIKASGSDETIEILTVNWADKQGFMDYLLTYAAGVILQRASAGKNDDAEKAVKAVKKAIERLISGVVPAGGGFTKLLPEEYAMKEALMSVKVKFEKGESVSECLIRLATKLTELVEAEEGASEDDIAIIALENEETIEATSVALQTELEASKVYKSALKARKAKAKTTTAAGSLIGKL